MDKIRHSQIKITDHQKDINFQGNQTPGETPDKLAELSTKLEPIVNNMGQELSLQNYASEFEVIQPNLSGFKILDKLGNGGMGIVFRAYDENLDQIVAIKMMHIKLNADNHALKRFVTEARLLARLRHEHIIQIYSADLHDGYPYFVMEYHSKGALSKHRASFAQPEKAAMLMAQVAKAIDFAHRQNVLHRDLKPANILLDSNSRAIVSDFGLARMTSIAFELPIQADTTVPYETGMTTAGSTLGTPAYMAPEQYYGGSLTAKVDIWAMGVILFELLSGNRPFQGIFRDVLAKEITSGLKDEPHRLEPSIPLKLSRIISKCLTNDPEKRYPTAGELANDLNQAYARRSRRAFLVASGLLLAGGGVAAGNQIKKQSDLDQRNKEYRDACAELRVDLQQNKSVDLLNKEHLPRAYFNVLGNPFTQLKNMKPDCFSQIVRDTLMIDCLDKIPADHFTLICRLNLIHLQKQTQSRFAIYFSHELVQVNDDNIHLMYAVVITVLPDQSRQACLALFGIRDDVLMAQHATELPNSINLDGEALRVELESSDSEIKCLINGKSLLHASKAQLIQAASRTLFPLPPDGRQIPLATLNTHSKPMMPSHDLPLGIFAHRISFEISELKLTTK